MKQLILWMLLLSMTIFQSCNPCNGVSCQNGGTCVSGNCQCPNGFEGSRCEIKSIDKFLGSYGGHCRNNSLTWWSDLFTLNVIEGTQNNEIIIDPLLYLDATNNGGIINQITCTVSGNNIISMASNSSNYSIQGTGNIAIGAGNQYVLTLNYQVTLLNNSTVYNCNAEFFKQ